VLNRLGDSDLTRNPTLQRILPRLLNAGITPKIVTSGVDGKYYLAPGQTVIRLGDGLLSVLQPADVDFLLDG
jgi:hypothetical protein